MPDRAITGCPDCPLREFLVLRLQLLQADDFRLGFGEPAHQHREAAINAVHVEGHDLHLFPPPFSGTNKIAAPQGELQTNQAYAITNLASQPAYETLERNTARNECEREKKWLTTTLRSRRGCRSGVSSHFAIAGTRRARRRRQGRGAAPCALREFSAGSEKEV